MPTILQMKESTEFVVALGLVAVLAFAPKLLSFFVESQLGKALSFAFVAWVWRRSGLVSLMLAVTLLRAMPSYEYASKGSLSTNGVKKTAVEEEASK